MKKALACLMIVVVFVGCGGGAPVNGVGNTMKTYPVSGIVTYKGAPLEGATVSFWGPKAPRAETAITNENGEFTMKAPGGENQITITKAEATTVVSPEPKGPEALADTSAKTGPKTKTAKEIVAEQKAARAAAEKAAKSKKKGEKPPEPTYLVPPAFTTLKDTPLKETVTPSGPNKFDFKLD